MMQGLEDRKKSITQPEEKSKSNSPYKLESPSKVSDSRASESQSGQTMDFLSRSKSRLESNATPDMFELKKQKLKQKKPEKSCLLPLFYKESFLIKYLDRPTKILQDIDLHTEFKRLKPTDSYWNTI